MFRFLFLDTQNILKFKYEYYLRGFSQNTLKFTCLKSLNNRLNM